MQFKRENKHMVDILFVISLFCVFAFSALMLVIIGADVYKSTVSHMDDNFAARTSYAYLSEKIRQKDCSEGIYVTEFGDGNALVLAEEINGTRYYTYLYRHNNSLKELFSNAPETLGPEAGQTIMDCTVFDITQVSSDLYYFHLEGPEGSSADLYVTTRCR